MPVERAPIRTILVFSPHCERMRGLIESRLPGLAVGYASAAGDLETALATALPDAVYVTRFSSGPPPDYGAIFRQGSVRHVCVGGAGYEHMGAWDPARVTVSNCSGVLAPFLAETMTGAMLALNGHFLKYWSQQRERRWRQHAFRPIAGQTLLVVGLGAIGACVAANAKALGMHVVAANRTPRPHPAVHEVHGLDRLDTLLPGADVVTLHCKSTADTRHLMSAERLARMKPGAILMNAARGAVIDEAALVAALRNGPVGAAYLDVFETEPLPQASPLWDMPNVMLTPHASDNTTDWLERFAAFFAANVERWNRREEMVNVVLP